MVPVRKETKPPNSSGSSNIAKGAAKDTGDNAVLQSLVDFLRYPNLKTCHRCHGRGVNYANSACETCKGTGKEVINTL